MTAPLRARLADAVRGWWGRNICADAADLWPEPPEIGTDDDWMDLADAVQDDGDYLGQCGDPRAHSLTGCPRCVSVIIACCAFDFDRSLADLLREGQR